MTAREYLSRYRYDERLVTGGLFDPQPISVGKGARVGVVLLNHGGPASASEVEDYLYRRFMDPVGLDLPLPCLARDLFSRALARQIARAHRPKYQEVGGASPLNRHARDQAAALQRRLNARFGPATEASFHVYVGMRHGDPSYDAVAAHMQADGVTHVVLLPLYPQYAKSTSGSVLHYWHAMAEAGEVPSCPTTYVHEYAAHPKLVQALSERMDEALQRFPRDVRDRVQVVFCADGTPARDLVERRDPYCCLVHTTVEQVTRFREAHDPGRCYHASFLEHSLIRGLEPRTAATIERLADEGHPGVLVVPVSFVSDHMQTAYTLDIRLRERALHAGIEHFEVTSGLNCHPLFIEALAECVAAQVEAPAASSQGDGIGVALPSAIVALPRLPAAGRSARCARCPLAVDACDWSFEPAVHVPVPEETVSAAG
ncbi:MAG: ferrochelatase [Rubricoccaceae bacterium]